MYHLRFVTMILTNFLYQRAVTSSENLHHHCLAFHFWFFSITCKISCAHIGTMICAILTMNCLCTDKLSYLIGWVPNSVPCEISPNSDWQKYKCQSPIQNAVLLLVNKIHNLPKYDVLREHYDVWRTT